MKKIVFTALAGSLLFAGCATNPNKAKEIETKIDNSQEVSAGENVGVKDGNMIVQKKVLLGEELRRIQTEVYETEDKVYGNRKYGSKGMYGVLKDCRMELSEKKNGGDGKLKWTEPMDRVTDKETEFKFGLDDNKQLIGVSEEFLSDRITRFKKYKTILQGREDEMQEKLDICKTELKSKKAEAPAANQ